MSEVRARGGLCYKVKPLTAGLPDRMVLLAGQVHLVEMKTETGELRAAQKVFRGRAAQRGVHVVVLYSREDIDRWLSSL